MIGYLVTWNSPRGGLSPTDWASCAEDAGLSRDLWPHMYSERWANDAMMAARGSVKRSYLVELEEHRGALVWRISGGRKKDKDAAILYRRAREDVVCKNAAHPLCLAFLEAWERSIPWKGLHAHFLRAMRRWSGFQLDGGIWYLPTESASDGQLEAMRETYARLPEGCSFRVYAVAREESSLASILEGVAARVQKELARPRTNKARLAGLKKLAEGVDAVAKATGFDLSSLGAGIVREIEKTSPGTKTDLTFAPEVAQAVHEIPIVQVPAARPSDSVGSDKPPPLLGMDDDDDDEPIEFAPAAPRQHRGNGLPGMSERKLRALAKQAGIKTERFTKEQLIAALERKGIS